MRESERSPTSSSTFAGKYWKEVGTWSSTAGQGGLHSVVWKHTDSVPLSLLVRKYRITLPPYTMTEKVTRGKYSFCIKRRICNKKSAQCTDLGPPREDKLCVALSLGSAGVNFLAHAAGVNQAWLAGKGREENRVLSMHSYVLGDDSPNSGKMIPFWQRINQAGQLT